MAPKYDKLASIFEGEKDVIIAKLDATEHPEIASRYALDVDIISCESM